MTSTEERTKLWRTARRLETNRATLTLEACAIASLLRIVQEEHDKIRAESKRDHEGDPHAAACIAMEVSGHWTTRALQALKTANGKRQVQAFVKAYNRATDADRAAKENES